MEYRVLGKLEVLRDGEPVDLGAYRQRALLALLLTATNRVFSTDQIIDALWGDDGDADRQSSLWTYVSGLRKVLEPEREKRTDGTVLLTRSPGYLIASKPGETDVERFEQLVAEGRSLIAADPAAASLVLGEALALWRGHAFEDFTYEAFAQTEIARLEEVRLEAVEARIEADLQRGLSRELVSELESLVRQQPLREGFTAQLMLALARSGRQADALRAFQQLRSRLGEELGIEPSGAVRRIEEQIVTGGESAAPVNAAVDGGQTGLAIRGYELREELGHRSSGIVYRAYQPSVGREVAIKVIGADLANDPDFIRSFEAEAQVVARLEHPHIVPLYDYWREPDAAYLVMRLMGGGTLADVIETSALTPEQTAGMVDQLGSALQAAHQANVLHGDIRPHNVLLDDEGNAYLSDFAITPADDPTAAAYAPPERLAHDEATAATDVYGLGVVVAQALTGLRGEVDQIRGALEPSVRTVIDRATAVDQEARYADVGSLVRSLHSALNAEAIAPLTTATELENPYKGLRAFGSADAGEFFGRERLVERLLARLGEAGTRGRFVAVVGPSGSGKSSVVRAGLLPALRRGALPHSAEWFTAEVTPGPHPFEQLEEALLRIAVDPPADLLELLTWSANGLHRAIERILPDDESQLVLVVDQFEELFTQAAPEVAERFVATLVDAVECTHSRVRVVTTLRADFYDRPLRHRALGELLREGTEVITPMTPEELERAITGPTSSLGVTFEPALVAELVRDVVDRAGALPLLQYALTELFDGRQGPRISEGQYQALGGVSGALVARAEGLLAQLGHDAQDAARQVFLRLVTLGEGSDDTRRRVLRSELEDLTVEPRVLDAVLETFGRHRLLSFDRDPVTRGPTVEISHEALLIEWDRLRGWIDGARHDVRNQRRLAEAMREWSAAGETDEYLLRGGRLQQLDGWATTTSLPLSQAEQAFLRASVSERERELAAEREQEERTVEAERTAKRRARQLSLAGVVGVVVAGLAIFGFVQWRSADDQRAEAEAAQDEAQRAQAEAEAANAENDHLVLAAELQLASEAALEQDPELALMLATAAVRETASLGYATEEAVDAVHWALQELGVQYQLDSEVLVAIRSGPSGLAGVWVIPPAELVAFAEGAVDRALTAEECAAYFSGACPPREPLTDLPLRFGDETYGVDPRVAGFFDSLVDVNGLAPLAGTRITVAAPFLNGDNGFAAELSEFTELTGVAIDRVANSPFDLIPLTEGRTDRPDVLIHGGVVPDWAMHRALDVEQFLDADDLRADYGDELLDPVSLPDSSGRATARGLPMQAGAKDLVWYPKGLFDEAGYTVPATWDGLMALSAQMVDDGYSPWCVGFESAFASGWLGTDLVEALVVRTAGLEVYDQWIAGDIGFSDPRIVDAARLAEELLFGEGFVRGGVDSVTQENFTPQLFRMFDLDPDTEAPDPDTGAPACWFTFQADTILRAMPEGVLLGSDLDYFRLPPVTAGSVPPIVGGTSYATATTDRPEIRAFMTWLARRSWGEIWVELYHNSAFNPANQRFRTETMGFRNPPGHPATPVRRRMAVEIQDALAAGMYRVDGSDRMPAPIGSWNERSEPGAFWQGMLDWVDREKSIEEVFADIDAEWASLRAAGES